MCSESIYFVVNKTLWDKEVVIHRNWGQVISSFFGAKCCAIYINRIFSFSRYTYLMEHFLEGMISFEQILFFSSELTLWSHFMYWYISSLYVKLFLRKSWVWLEEEVDLWPTKKYLDGNVILFNSHQTLNFKKAIFIFEKKYQTEHFFICILQFCTWGAFRELGILLVLPI